MVEAPTIPKRRHPSNWRQAMTDNTATPTKNENGWIPASVPVAETVTKGNERKQVFKEWIEYHYPTLDTLGSDFPAPDSYQEEKVQGGEEERINVIPVYDDPRVQYAQDCLRGAVQTTAKNRAKSDPSQIAADWDSLLAGASGEKFGTIYKAFRVALAEYLSDHTAYTDAQAGRILAKFDLRGLGEMAEHKRRSLKAKVFDPFVAAIGDQAGLIRSALVAVDAKLSAAEDDLGFLDDDA